MRRRPAIIHQRERPPPLFSMLPALYGAQNITNFNFEDLSSDSEEEDPSEIEERNASLLVSCGKLLEPGSELPDGDKTLCSICTFEFDKEDQITQLRCHDTHLFHRDCLRQQFKYK